MVLVLHAGNTNKNAFKTLIAAEYSGVEVILVKNFEMGITNKSPKFLKMNLIGKVPVLETPDGPLFENNAISRYVTRLKGNNPLYSSSLIEYAHIEQWIDFASLEIDTHISNWYYPRNGYVVYLPPTEIDHHLVIDSVVWASTASGICTINSAYKALRPIRPKVPWYKMVWVLW